MALAGAKDSPKAPSFLIFGATCRGLRVVQTDQALRRFDWIVDDA